MKTYKTVSQGGFTLVELVVVMVILGILAATALPKFMNVNTQAHRASVDGVGGAFGSAVALTRAQWIANGSTGAVANVNGFGDGTVDTNTAGWPVGTGGNATLTTTAHCVEVWDGIMQNPPTAAASGTGIDYLVTVSTNTCTYTYQGDTGVTRTIAYDSTNGDMTITNP